MKLNRNKIFGIGFAIIVLFITINRVDFLIGSTFTKGKVIRFKDVPFGRGITTKVPIIQFSARQEIHTFQGEINSELKAGEEIEVVYKLDDPLNANVFSFVGFILTPMIYALLPLLIFAAAIFSFLNKNETVTFSMKGISRNRPVDLKSFNAEENLPNPSTAKMIKPGVRRR